MFFKRGHYPPVKGRPLREEKNSFFFFMFDTMVAAIKLEDGGGAAGGLCMAITKRNKLRSRIYKTTSTR